MTTTPALATLTVEDWDAAETYLDEHTSPSTYRLVELTANHDSDLHEIRLDPETRTVWWAYHNSPLGGEGWTIEQLSPKEAAERVEPIVDLIQDRMDDPEGYTRTDQADDDQDALDEYAAILRLGLPEEPRAARAEISRQRALLARTDTLWQRTDADLVRDVVNSQRNGNKRAAGEILGVSDMQVGRLISADDRRREEFAVSVREARQRDRDA